MEYRKKHGGGLSEKKGGRYEAARKGIVVLQRGQTGENVKIRYPRNGYIYKKAGLGKQKPD